MADTTDTSIEIVSKEEMEQAQKSGVVDFSEKKEKPGNYTHVFSKPVTIEGTRYESLTFYFENLKGEDMEAIERELQDRNIIVITAEVSSPFQSALAARAARVPSDEIRRLPLRDYLAIKNKARAFLLNQG